MRPMDTAPTDGRAIRLHMPDGSSFLAKPVDGLLDSNDEFCWGWGAINGDEAPADWTDGLCWEVNENGRPSTQPVAWSPAEATEPVGVL